MEIYWFDRLDSTQTHALSLIQTGALDEPAVIAARMQTDGIGSRDNSWQGAPGNLFCSIITDCKDLPRDLQMQSASLYFGFLIKEVLKSYVQEVWLKWPNDIYLGEHKVGGLICWRQNRFVIAGVGINLQSSPPFYGLDITTPPPQLVEKFVDAFKKKPTWKEVFSKYRLEFDNSKRFHMHQGHEKIALAQTSLQKDGSLIYQGKRIYSLR